MQSRAEVWHATYLVPESLLLLLLLVLVDLISILLLVKLLNSLTVVELKVLQQGHLGQAWNGFVTLASALGLQLLEDLSISVGSDTLALTLGVDPVAACTQAHTCQQSFACIHMSAW